MCYCSGEEEEEEDDSDDENEAVVEDFGELVALHEEKEMPIEVVMQRHMEDDVPTQIYPPTAAYTGKGKGKMYQ